jgi:hypothetical protein
MRTASSRKMFLFSITIARQLDHTVVRNTVSIHENAASFWRLWRKTETFQKRKGFSPMTVMFRSKSCEALFQLGLRKIEKPQY